MSLGAPQVYIGRQRMNDYALSKTPMLAGLSFTWGTDSQTDFDDPATLQAELLIREPSDLTFLVKGAEFGVLDPGSGETLFAGRISSLKAKRDKRKKKALLISITAADTQADLAGYRIGSARWLDRDSSEYMYATSARRRNQLRGALPAGWTIDGAAAADWFPARVQVLDAEPYLPVLDRHVRTVIGRRAFTSRYVPGTGLVPRVTITNERSKSAPIETLQARSNGQWFRNPTAPIASAHIHLDAGAVSEETEWEKTPDDTVTDVALTSWGSKLGNDENTGQLVNQPTDSMDIWADPYLAGSSTEDDLRWLQKTYGFQQLQLDTDMFAGTVERMREPVTSLIDYWLEADTLWRPTSLTIPDSRKVSDYVALSMLSATRRYLAYLSVSRLQENTPAGGSRVRGYILGGTATWTGKKWQIELTLGRVPRPAAGAGQMTFNSIRTHTDPLISQGTAASVGPELTFADFEYIGA